MKLISKLLILATCFTASLSAGQGCCGSNYNVNFSFQPYWAKMCNTAMEYASESGSSYALDTDWDFGYRLTGGLTSTCGNWGLEARWNSYTTCTSDSVEGDNIVPHLAGNNSTSTKGSLDWEHHYLDVVGTYGVCNFCQCLEVRPYLGLRYYWHCSNYKENNAGSSFTVAAERSSLKKDFDSLGYVWGLNLRTGLPSLCGFRPYLLGHLGMSYVAGDLKDKRTVLVNTVETVSKSNRCVAFGSYEGCIGVGFDYCLCNLPLNLAFSYEFQNLGFNDDNDDYPSATSFNSNFAEVSLSAYVFRIGMSY